MEAVRTKPILGISIGARRGARKSSLRRRVYYTPSGGRSVFVPRKIPLAPYILSAILCVFSIFLLAMLGVRENPSTAEWWTRHIERGWTEVIGRLTSIMPISVYELIVVCLIAAAIVLIILFVKNLWRGKLRRILVGALSIAVGAAYVLDLYMLSMGFGYYREQMPLPQSGYGYDAHQAATATEYFLDDFYALSNKLERDENGCVIPPYSHRELAKLLAAEYSRLDDDFFGDYFFSYTPNVKPVVNSWFLSYLRITGITFLPTGEASVNVASPPTYAVATMAHELAHTKGVQREGDANLIASYILVTSQDEYLRYCGYYDCLYKLVDSVKLAGDNKTYNELMQKIDGKVYAEYRFENEYWAAQPDVIGRIGEFVNDVYLMFNGADNGTGSYNDGNKSEAITPIDPDTGEPEVNPDTGKPVIIPVYSTLQKMYFAIYEKEHGAPQKSEAV